MTNLAAAKERVDRLLPGAQEELIQLLSGYIQQPSTNLELGSEAVRGQEAQCQLWLRQQLDQTGAFDEIDWWEVEPGRPNLAAIYRGAGGGRSLLINGHSDVVPVPADTLSAWSVDPWGGSVREGRIWGRGACDMKGPNAAFLVAAQVLRRAGVRLKGDLILTVVSGEESGNRTVGCDSILERGYKAPLCLVAEPTGMQVIPVITGEVYFKITVKGKSAHIGSRPACIHPQPYGSRPPGTNAIEKMWKIQRALFDLERDWTLHSQHPAMAPGSMTLNLGVIQGGDVISALAGECTVVGSVLFTPDRSVAQTLEEITRAVESVAATDQWLREHPPVIEAPYIVAGKQGVDATGDPANYEVLRGAFRTALGREAGMTAAAFTSDANFLHERGQTCIMFGPGDLSMGTHGVDEFLPLDQLLEACRVYAHFIIDWCGVADPT